VALTIVRGIMLDADLNDRGLRKHEIFTPLRDRPERVAAATPTGVAIAEMERSGITTVAGVASGRGPLAWCRVTTQEAPLNDSAPASVQRTGSAPVGYLGLTPGATHTGARS